MNTGAKQLVVGPSWIGDMVMAQSLYKLLASRDPDTEIHVIAPAWSIPVLERMPEVTRALELPVAHGEAGIGKRWRLARRLRHEGYQRAIVLPRSLKAALVPFFASVPVRTGYRGEWRFGLINDMRAFDAERLDQTVKRFVALGLGPEEAGLPSIPTPRLDIDEDNLRIVAARLGLDTESDAVAIIPGAEYGPAKRWPSEYYADLASRLVRVGLKVWVLGSEKEHEIGEAVSGPANHPNAINLCGETSLADVIDLLGAARVAVTNDSGLMHVAAAVGTHVVAVYGSSSPGFTPPLTEAKDVFYLDLECSPCFQRECPLGHFRCMTDLGVDEICSAVVTALGGPETPREGEQARDIREPGSGLSEPFGRPH